MASAPDSPPTRARGRSMLPIAIAIAIAIAAAVALSVAGDGTARLRSGDQDLAARQAEVKSAGRAVMPFDLDRTTHVFTPLPEGGRQIVTADDPADTQQIELIRMHLREEMDEFRRGDFEDPGKIHGRDMSGLAELRTGARRIDIRYDELDRGAHLTYRTNDRRLIGAIHVWFSAQTEDHGTGHR